MLEFLGFCSFFAGLAVGGVILQPARFYGEAVFLWNRQSAHFKVGRDIFRLVLVFMFLDDSLVNGSEKKVVWWLNPWCSDLNRQPSLIVTIRLMQPPLEQWRDVTRHSVSRASKPAVEGRTRPNTARKCSAKVVRKCDVLVHPIHWESIIVRNPVVDVSGILLSSWFFEPSWCWWMVAVDDAFDGW